jgi:hypothetical protein
MLDRRLLLTGFKALSILTLVAGALGVVYRLARGRPLDSLSFGVMALAAFLSVQALAYVIQILEDIRSAMQARAERADPHAPVQGEHRGRGAARAVSRSRSVGGSVFTPRGPRPRRRPHAPAATASALARPRSR